MSMSETREKYRMRDISECERYKIQARERALMTYLINIIMNKNINKCVFI